MLEVMAEVRHVLPAMLGSLKGWNSLLVDYEQPRVERLWRQWGPCRLYLHRIHPCEKPFYHPHLAPSVVEVLTEGYEMGLGVEGSVALGNITTGAGGALGRGGDGGGVVVTASGLKPSGVELVGPPVAAELWIAPGTTYAMIDIGAWHWVKPRKPSLSIMLSGMPWSRPVPWSNMPRESKPLEERVSLGLLREIAENLRP